MIHFSKVYISFVCVFNGSSGYLKVIKDRGENQYELVIPNKEVYEIYKQSFMSYFEDYTTSRKGELYQELVDGDAKKVNLLLNDILLRSISYFVSVK